jgi:hypothetical protein
MLAHGPARRPRISALLGLVRAVFTSFLNARELRGLDRAEFEQIACDLNLSPTELYMLSTGENCSDDLLEKRLEEFGLSPERVRRRHPQVFQDLERVCGSCHSRKRCASEFEQRTPSSGRSSYCPNSQTLQALEQERLRIERRSSLPIGPSCC